MGEDVQPLTGETKDSSKTLSQMLPRKHLNASLDMLFSLNPQVDKMTGTEMKIQNPKGPVHHCTEPSCRLKSVGIFGCIEKAIPSYKHQLLTNVLIANCCTMPLLQQIIFYICSQKIILVLHKLHHQLRAVTWISLGNCKKWVWGKANAVCHIISFFSVADRTAACYYSAPQETFSCQESPEPARD